MQRARVLVLALLLLAAAPAAANYRGDCSDPFAVGSWCITDVPGVLVLAGPEGEPERFYSSWTYCDSDPYIDQFTVYKLFCNGIWTDTCRICSHGRPELFEFECSDGVDNDGDLLPDFPSDLGCVSPLDDSEIGDCSNAIDDDGDGFVDGDDPGCVDASDGDERIESLPCDDGFDNDLDGRVDFLAPGTPPPYWNSGDPGCSSPFTASERPECQDGIDNDGDGAIDFDGGDSLDIEPRDGLIDRFFDLATPAVGAPDPQCSGAPHRNSEAVDEVPGPSGTARLGLFGILLASGIAAASAARHRVRVSMERLGGS